MPSIKLEWYMLLFHKLLCFPFTLVYIQQEIITEIEATARHLVAAFSDGESSVCSWAVMGKVRKPDQNQGLVPT